MKLRFIPGLVVAVWLCGRVLPAGAAASANPYTPIVERNVFGLVPLPVHNPADDVPVTPPPKITPNGIMTLFGKLEVLFKVQDNTPGKPSKEDSYVMCEGDRQDDIEVQKIDQKAEVITFNNHGVVQELPLVAVKDAKGGGVPAPALRPGGFVGRPPFGFGGRFGRAPNNPAASSPSPASVPAGAITPASYGSPGGFDTPAPANSAPAQPPLTPEQQVIMIEANRLATQDAVNKGDMPPLPPTVMTPSDATGIGGAPLVVNPPGSGNGGDAVPAPGR
jgi:hypothetical protein